MYLKLLNFKFTSNLPESISLNKCKIWVAHEHPRVLYVNTFVLLACLLFYQIKQYSFHVHVTKRDTEANKPLACFVEMQQCFARDRRKLHIEFNLKFKLSRKVSQTISFNLKYVNNDHFPLYAIFAFSTIE